MRDPNVRFNERGEVGKKFLTSLYSIVLTVFSLGARVMLAYTLSATAMGLAGVWWSVPIGWSLADTVGLACFAAKRRTLLETA